MQERIHKLLAHAGFGSRRACEELIRTTRVTVNGKAAQVGDKATLGTDDLRVDGRRVRAEKQVYFLVNKPPGFLCTNADPEGRRMVGNLLVGVAERVYPVGRLDGDSRGLVLMTNDGDLAAKLTHPRNEVAKTYEAEVEGRVTPEDVKKLQGGVWLSEGKTGATEVRVLKANLSHSKIEITLREGRNREVRRMLVKLGHAVRTLTRTRIGPLSLRGLGVGKYRQLHQDEIKELVKTVERQVRRAGQKTAKVGPEELAAEKAAKRKAKYAPGGRGPVTKPGSRRGLAASKGKREKGPEGGKRKVYDFTL
jgi:23S rRNA pseudouridine2605 synthase